MPERLRGVPAVAAGSYVNRGSGLAAGPSES
jgi:hypothetical protein